jgi:glycosyltransferase involved in cell wall biosynthesis
MGGTLHVGIDASDWPAKRGVGRYVRCLTDCLARRPDLALTLFSPQDLSGPLPPGCGVKTDTRRLPWYSWRLPRLARRYPVDVMFFPSNHSWWRGPAPSVLTVHDVAFMHFPQRIFGSRLEAYYEIARLKRGVRCATRVCTDSDASKTDIVRMLGCPASKISVALPGVAELFRRPITVTRDQIAAKFCLPDTPYVLYAGGLDFRKNIPRLIEAFGQVVANGLPHHLLLVGEYGANRRYYPDVDALVIDLGLSERVRRLSGVGDEELKTLYANAALFVFPSLFEGFGLPPLEAMAHGAPVACSNAASLPEVVGDAAESFDPLSAEAQLAAMLRVLTSEARTAELRALGQQRAELFTFERTAEVVAAVLRESASPHARMGA